jgi:protein-L-isoaspartate(D-aspartate) O-methyltransferase
MISKSHFSDTPSVLILRNDAVDKLVQLKADMLDRIRAYGMTNKRILETMENLPRHKFIPHTNYVLDYGYGDFPCTIGYGQTISQPYIVAYMTELLDIKQTDTVLEIGTGSGYQTAVLACLAASVFTIERIPELLEHASIALGNEGLTNVTMKADDGHEGWPEHSPYQGIMVTCSPASIPTALVDQLDDGGRLILPVGDIHQSLMLITKEKGKIIQRRDIPVRFVPMLEG